MKEKKLKKIDCIRVATSYLLLHFNVIRKTHVSGNLDFLTHIFTGINIGPPHLKPPAFKDLDSHLVVKLHFPAMKQANYSS